VEITPETIAAEVKSSVDAVKIDMATVQASVDALRTEVKNAASAGKVEVKSLAAILDEKVELKSFAKGSRPVEVKAVGIDMLRDATVGASQTLTTAGSYVAQPNRMTHVRDFLRIGKLATPYYKYDRELLPTGTPAITAEGQRKPQISFKSQPVVANAGKIASFYKLTTETVHDAPAFAYSLQGRGVEMTLNVEDYELLYGDGLGDNIQGIMPLATPFATTLQVADAQIIDVIRAAVNQVRLSQYRANVVFMSPSKVAELELTKDSEGRYILPNIFSTGPSSVAHVTIAEIDAMNEDEFLVGALDMAVDTFEVEPLGVKVSDSNEDDFVTNKVTVVIEERLLQAVTRPSALVKGTFTAAIAALA
jgi:HK97 family phage major capsid protein